jgi:chromate transporter
VSTLLPVKTDQLSIARAIFPLGLTAFGGPQAHIGLIQRELVANRRWTDERTFAELLSLCSALPGPTSTQMIIGMGALRGGLPGALVALACWAAPAATLASIAGIGLVGGIGHSTPPWLEGAQPAAVALVGLSAFALGRKVITDRAMFLLMVFGFVATLIWQSPFAFPATLAIAAIAGWLRRKAPHMAGAQPAADGDERTVMLVSRRVSIVALVSFCLLLAALPVTHSLTRWQPLAWIDGCFRAGSLVFGGGQVVLGVLLTEFNRIGGISQVQMVNGISFVQILPGPLFSIGGYIGGVEGGVLGAAACLAAIFLPGMLLMLGVLPWWHELRSRQSVRAALAGVNACAIGLIVTAAVVLGRHVIVGGVDAVLLLVDLILAARLTRLPPAVIIIGSALVGWPLHLAFG